MVGVFNDPESPMKLVDGPRARKDQPLSREAEETEELWIVAAYLTTGMLPPVPKRVYTEITNGERTSSKTYLLSSLVSGTLWLYQMTLHALQEEERQSEDKKQ
jgi:hypothetical protein